MRRQRGGTLSGADTATNVGWVLEQRELQHRLMHKGLGFWDDTPDRFVCVDEECPRNPR